MGAKLLRPASQLFDRLFVGDPNSHPSALGQKLSAAVLFETINEDTQAAWVPARGEFKNILGAPTRPFGSLNLNDISGDWVGKYELEAPSTWRVRDGKVFQVKGNREASVQGLLSGNGEWL